MSLLTDLIAAWELNEASGSAVDSHGGSTLTQVGTVSTGTGLVYPSARGTFSPSNYFNIADNAALSTGDIDFAFEVWVQPNTVAANFDVISKWGAQLEYILTYTAGTGWRWFVSGNGSSTVVVNGGLATAGPWYQVFAWHDSAANEIGIAVNAGTPVTTATSAGVFDGSSAFRIGHRVSGASNTLNGLVGPARFWKRVPTSAERTALYNGGAGLAYSALGGGPIAPIAMYLNRMRRG